MKHKLFLSIIIISQIISAAGWISANSDFPANFHYSSFDLQLRLIESIHNDASTPLWLVRVFHNKCIGSIFDVYANYLEFWRFQFLLSFISLTGIIGVFINLYYFYFEKNKKKIHLFFLVLLLLMPFNEIFFSDKLPFVVRAISIAVPFVSWSVLGYLELFKRKKVPIFVFVGLIILNFWLMEVK